VEEVVTTKEELFDDLHNESYIAYRHVGQGQGRKSPVPRNRRLHICKSLAALLCSSCSRCAVLQPKKNEIYSQHIPTSRETHTKLPILVKS